MAHRRRLPPEDHLRMIDNVVRGECPCGCRSTPPTNCAQVSRSLEERSALLEALREMLRTHSPDGKENVEFEWLDARKQAVDAIAKAEGR